MKNRKLSKPPGAYDTQWHLALACVKAAQANNYMIHVEKTDFDTASDAGQIIIDWENSGKISHALASRAFHYINESGGGEASGMTY